MLRELWPGMPDSALEESRKARFEHGCIWGLVSIGDTYTKTCCKQPCPCACKHQEGAWCPERKDICVDSSWKFRHVTQLENPIALRFPVHVRPMPGLFRQRIPIAAIPLDIMTDTQKHLWRHSVCEMNCHWASLLTLPKHNNKLTSWERFVWHRHSCNSWSLLQHSRTSRGVGVDIEVSAAD